MSPMRKIERKPSVRGLFVFFVFLYLNTIESQAGETYQIMKKLSLKEAISFKKANSFGIVTQTSAGSSARAIVSLSTVERVEFEYLNGGLESYFSDQINLYKAFADGSNASISHTGYQSKYYYRPFFSFLNFYAGIPYNSASATTDSKEYINYMLRLAYAEIAEKDQGTFNWFFFNADPTIDVQINLTLENGMKLTDIVKIELPGIPTIYSYDFRQNKLDELRDILENPNKYPNYVMLAAHRGYWKYAPQNSLEAFKNAIDFGADIVEIDISTTADNKIIIAYDAHLGRLTNIPEKLKNPIFQENGAGYYLISKMKLCDIRPDLCPGNPDYNITNPNNCNTCTGTP
ncbi:MAG TPA: hypothetical protein DDZ41_00675, partial [Flavobacterium sp.]|nr:hypothetical protein [Flavobacterium sp.]